MPSGRSWAGLVLYQVAGVGVIEESSKFLVFVALERRFRLAREPADGVLLGAAVALGFAAVENVQYALDYGADVAFVRGFVTPLDHMVFASIWGFVFARQAFGHDRLDRKQRRLVALAVLPAGFVHGIGNVMMELGPVASLVYDAATAACAIGILRVLVRTSPFGLRDLRAARASLEMLESAFVRDPDNPSLHLRAAHFCLRTGEAARAGGHVAAYLRLRPGSPYATGLSGAVLVLQGHHGAGERLLDQAQAYMSDRDRRVFRRNLSRIVQSPGVDAAVLRLWLASARFRSQRGRREARFG